MKKNNKRKIDKGKGKKTFDVGKVREDFPILKRKIYDKKLVYLDNAATSQKPKQVIKAIVDYYEKHNANIHRGVHTLSEEATVVVEKAREKVAGFIGVKNTKEVIFVRNASEAINLVMYSWAREKIGERDAVIVTEAEHHANLVTWQEFCKETGAELRIVKTDKEGMIQYDGVSKNKENGVVMGSLESLLDERVKLVAVTQVSNLLGNIFDIARMVKMVRKKSKLAKVLVDGSQSVPHMKVDVLKMGIDFLVFSAHKMLGPTGMGVLWGKEELLNEARPFLFGGDMISEVKLEGAKWNELPWKFEAGTPNMAGIVGLGAAVDYLSSLGMDRVREHEKGLMKYGLEKFEELENQGIVEIYGTRDLSKRGGILTFNVKGVHAHDVAQVLDREGIAVRSGQHCAQPLTERLGQMAMVRASVYIYNTREEIDYLIEKIGEVLKVFKI